MFNALSFITYTFITAITPGPNNIMSMTNASRLGLRKSFPFNLGIFAGFIIVLSLCYIFSSLLESLIPQISMVMKFLGAAYMLYLAWKTIQSALVVKDGPIRSGFVTGMLLQFVNPKIYVYAFASFVYFMPYYTNPLVIIGFILFMSAMGFVCTLLWSVFGSAFKSIFEKHGRTVNIILTALLLYCAVSLFL